jgi:membrane protease YdiL (CAAX protease family)
MDEGQSTPSSLFDRATPITVISLGLGLLFTSFLLQSVFDQLLDDAVLALTLSGLLAYVAGPALLWQRIGLPGATALSMREDLGLDALRRPEAFWIGAIAVGMLLPLDRLGEWNQVMVSVPESYVEWQRELLPKDARDWVTLYLGLGVLVPIGEEILFRGLIQQAVRTVAGPVLASVLAGTLFGLLHLEPWFLLALSLTGILLGLVYEFTDTLLAPILLHVLYNCAVLTIWIHSTDDGVPGNALTLGLMAILGAALVLLALQRLRTMGATPPDSASLLR